MLLVRRGMMLALCVGGALCALGCEDDQAVQAGKPSAPPSVVTTRPSDAPSAPVKASTTRPAPTSRPAAASVPGPVPIRKPRPKPIEIEMKAAMADVELTPEQFQLFDALCQKSLELQMRLDQREERNVRLTEALIESREIGRRLQDDLRRSSIVQEIQKHEVAELKDRLARLDAPEARQKILVRLGEAMEQNEELQKRIRALSHTVVRQADELKTSQTRRENLRQDATEAKRQVRSLEMQLARANRRLEVFQQDETTLAVIAPVAPDVVQPIAGEISAVNDMVVMVDLGRDNDLEEGMRLIAYRDDKFIGYLRVEQVGTSESACTFTRQILQPCVGDKVIDRLE